MQIWRSTFLGGFFVGKCVLLATDNCPWNESLYIYLPVLGETDCGMEVKDHSAATLRYMHITDPYLPMH